MGNFDKRENNKNFFKVFAIYFVVLVLFVAVRICSNFGVFDAIKDEIAIDLVSTTIIQVFILLLVPFCLYLILFKKKPKNIIKDFGYKKLSAKAILICFGIGVLAYILNIFVSSTFAFILNTIGFNPQYVSGGASYDTFPKFLIGVFSVAILPAICEEFTHRGLLLGVGSKIIGYKKAIVLSSIMFGLMHLNIQQFFYATILGLLMGFVFAVTKSIFPAMIIHFCNNFINVFVSYAESAKIFKFSLSNFLETIASNNVFLFFIIATTVAFLCIFALILLLKKLYMETGFKDYKKKFENIASQLKSDASVTDSDVAYTFENIVAPNLKTPNGLFELMIGEHENFDSIQVKSKIPMIVCFVLGILITVFTFIWGVV